MKPSGKTKIQKEKRKVTFKTVAFKPYKKTSNKENGFPRSKKSSPLKCLTSELIEVYMKCNPHFQCPTNLIPRRVLTKPSEAVGNGGFDNVNSDFILHVNDILGSYHQHQYQVIDLLGQGTFGQVVKTVNIHTHEIFAIKIVKNKPAYFNQGLVEIQILEMLNHRFDRDESHHVVRLKDYFVFRQHLCLVFELLSINLFELLKQNNYRGLPMTLIRCFMLQLLDCLIILSRANVIHCDLKPENILLENLTSPNVKIIDFGSACFEKQTVYSYIQSRFYRSPEVITGLQYNSAIDIWSLGCIAAELFLGIPLFAGSSEYDQLVKIVDMFGHIPGHILDGSSKTSKFYKKEGCKWVLKTQEEFARDSNQSLAPSKRYFKYKTLEEIIENYHYKEGITQHEMEKEKNLRTSFCDLLNGLLNLDPEKRWTAEQARGHPFITGEMFTGPYSPPTPIYMNKTPPRVIPWGIQNASMAQTRVAMSYPDAFIPGSFVSTDVMQDPSFMVGSFPLTYDQALGIPPSPQMPIQSRQNLYHSFQPHSYGNGDTEQFYPLVGNPAINQIRNSFTNDMRRPQSPKQKKSFDGRKRGYSFGSYAQAGPMYHSNPPTMSSIPEIKAEKYPGKNRKNRSYSHNAHVPHFLNVETSNIVDRSRVSPKDSPRSTRSYSNDSSKGAMYDISPKSSPRTSSDIPRNDLSLESNSPGDWEDQMVFELEPTQDTPNNGNGLPQNPPDIYSSFANMQIGQKSFQRNQRGNSTTWNGKPDSYKSKKGNTEKKYFREKKGAT